MGDGLRDRRSDAELLAAVRNGGRRAFAELYERYFGPVYDFALRITRNDEAAAEVVQDTFLRVMRTLDGLQEGLRFKDRIFSIARTCTLDRLERGANAPPLPGSNDESGQHRFDVIDDASLANRQDAPDAAALVWEAARNLDPRQMTLLDLHLRKGLDNAGIATVMGVTKENGEVLLNRLKRAAEDAISAFIFFHDVREHCETLDATLTAADIHALDSSARQLIGRHVDRCRACKERRQRLGSPLAVYGSFAPVSAPPGLKERVAADLVRQWPHGVTFSAAPSGGANASKDDDGPGGTPVPPGGADYGWSRRYTQATVGVASIVAVIGVLLLAPLSPVSVNNGSGGESSGPPGPGPTPQPTPPAATPTATQAAILPAGAPTPTPSPARETPEATVENPPEGSATTVVDVDSDPSPTATATATVPVHLPATATPSDTPSPTITATSTPTATPEPCVPQLGANVDKVVVTGRHEGSFVLLNTAGCPASVTLSLSEDVGWLQLYTTMLELEGPDQAPVYLALDRGRLQPGRNIATIVAVADEGGKPFEIDVIEEEGATPTPTATPTSTATPTPDTATASTLP